MFRIIWPDHVNILKLLTTPSHGYFDSEIVPWVGNLTKNYKMSNARGFAHPPGGSGNK